MTPIIEVLIDAEGNLAYRCRPVTNVDTKAYGEIIASLPRLIAQMMASEGGFEEARVYAEILHFFGEEIDAPRAKTTSETTRLQ